MKKGNSIGGLRLVNNEGNRAPQMQDMMVRLIQIKGEFQEQVRQNEQQNRNNHQQNQANQQPGIQNQNNLQENGQNI